MKTIIRLTWFAVVLLTFSGLSSCEKSSDTVPGNAEFALQLPDELASLKSGSEADSATFSFNLLVSVTKPDGTIVLEDELIPIYIFGSGFVSEKLELKAGEYLLTKFMVIDPSGKVLFASPLEGSPMAYLVNKPLPLPFKILANEVTRVVPEVLPVNDLPPDQFGYVSFGIQVIRPLEFYTFAYLYHPLIMAPTMMTEAKLTVFAKDGWHYSFKLQKSVNRILVRGGSDKYILLVEKEGYEPQKYEISAGELIKHTANNPLALKIPWGEPSYYTLTMQPGPEKGMDAMISNLEPDINFGMHKYFEATFLTEPVLTVMRSNRSLIWFDRSALPAAATIKKAVLTLHFAPSLSTNSDYVNPGTSNTGALFTGGVLQQIVQPWEEEKVTWVNQPNTIEANQVYIPRVGTNSKFIEVDITKQFVPLQEVAAPNYGMLFRQWPDNSFPDSGLPQATIPWQR